MLKESDLTPSADDPVVTTLNIPQSTTLTRTNEAEKDSSFSAANPFLSIVVPTRNEAANVVELSCSLAEALGEIAYEIIFVDDSDDDTPKVVQELQATADYEVRLLHRAPGERIDGLGGAVVMGLRAARAPWICVMDGDLQHPPALVSPATGESAI